MNYLAKGIDREKWINSPIILPIYHKLPEGIAASFLNRKSNDVRGGKACNLRESYHPSGSIQSHKKYFMS